jgi:hypothetical protein
MEIWMRCTAVASRTDCAGCAANEAAYRPVALRIGAVAVASFGPIGTPRSAASQEGFSLSSMVNKVFIVEQL